MSTHESTPTETPRDEFGRPMDYTTPQTKPFSMAAYIEAQQEKARQANSKRKGRR